MIATDARIQTESELLKPIQFLKGVGPHKSEILKKVGVVTTEDLVFYFPRDHQDRRLSRVREARPGEKQAIVGIVQSVDFKRVGKMLGQARAWVKDETGLIEAVWFKRLAFAYDVFSGLKKALVPGRKVFLYGALELQDEIVQLKVEDYDVLDDEAGDDVHMNRIVPIYPLTEGLNDRWLRDLIFRVVQSQASYVKDSLPEAIRNAHSLLPLAEAITKYHFPKNKEDRDKARERLAFDEFFTLELALALNRRSREHESKGFVSVVQRTLLTPFKNKLAYEFTRSQTRVINEIFRDMQRSSPMNRLLQGDVGSGKTIVALSAALLAIENKRQVAFLAPTEILAGQHALSISKYFEGLSVKWALLTGATPKAERKKILENLASGKIDLVVGTHAILNQDVAFKQLGLVVIDEQHRFGVRQREKLVMKTTALLERVHPDVLIMTATPIPRTLALTLYGDLDVSVLNDMPPGRSAIKTSLDSEQRALGKIDAAIAEGRQAYIVFPLVEESEASSRKAGATIQAATKEFHRLKERFPNASVGLIHGQMKPAEKQKVMDEFRSGKTKVLVATPVIEVGIDVPNATVILIYNPERFGLAQLHQLRGRVGRGAHDSECLLVVGDPMDVQNDRLSVFCSLGDGFRLAEEDLKLRGPGEFLGEAQHGIPFFRVGDLLRDALFISQAREAATRLVNGEWALKMNEFMALNTVLKKKFGSKIQLSQIG